MEQNAPPVDGRSLRRKCECEECHRLGAKTTHNDPSHDQRLDQQLTFVCNGGVAKHSLRFVGGTTKCGRVMIQYLSQNEKDFAGKSAVELGSGAGIVGICLALLGSSVTLTDQEPVMETLQDNVNLNAAALGDSRKRVKLAPLQWGEDAKGMSAEFDVIVGSDLIFAKENIPPLVKTFNYFARNNPKSVAYLASIKRFAWEDSFFDLMQQTFTQERVHQDGDIEIFRFTPKPARVETDLPK